MSNFFLEIKSPNPDDYFRHFYTLPEMLNENIGLIVFVSVLIILSFIFYYHMKYSHRIMNQLHMPIIPPTPDSDIANARLLETFLHKRKFTNSSVAEYNELFSRLDADMVDYSFPSDSNPPLEHIVHTAHTLGCSITLIDNETNEQITTAP